jgi:hypothetical protein
VKEKKRYVGVESARGGRSRRANQRKEVIEECGILGRICADEEEG